MFGYIEKLRVDLRNLAVASRSLGSPERLTRSASCSFQIIIYFGLPYESTVTSATGRNRIVLSSLREKYWKMSPKEKTTRKANA